jgi:tubulin monoglycylase TTLL3/8
LNSQTVDKKLLQTACDVSFRRVRDLDDLIDDPTAFGALVSDAEWKILAADELTEESLAAKKHVDWMNKNDTKMAIKKKKKKRKTKNITNKVASNEDEDAEYGFEDDEEASNDEGADDEDGAARDRQICKKLPEFKKILDLVVNLKSKFPQMGIDGERNIWIVKPAGSSRGRGITLLKNLVEIIDLTK